MKIVMCGVCSNCGRLVVRKPPIDAAVCQCASKPVQVELKQMHVVQKMDENRELECLRKIKAQPLCPECGRIMTREGNGWWACTNQGCPLIKGKLNHEGQIEHLKLAAA